MGDMIFDDKTIICNDCLGARLYEKLGKQFSNPFMWNVIKPADFLKLCANWNKIDFEKIRSIYDKENNMYGLEIDNKISIYYPHYKKDDSHLTPFKQGIDVFYKFIDKYITEKYFARLERMKERPIFILDVDRNFGSNYEPEHVRIFSRMKDIEKIIVSKPDERFNDLIDVKLDNSFKLSSGEKARQVIKHYYE